MDNSPTSIELQNQLWDEGEVNQILTFTLNDEEYGVDILQVNTIRGWTPITVLPDTPKYIKGVLNLLGVIVPIIDLRLRFGLPEKEYTSTTVVILLNVHYQDNDLVIGIVVDSVSDTYTIKPENIKPKPQVGEHVQVNYLKGLVDINEQLVLLLDSTKLLSEKQLEEVSNIV